MSSTGTAHSAAQRPVHDLWRTVLVPLDLGLEADRALPVGAALARRLGVGLDVACVSSPGENPLDDEEEVRQHARLAGVEVDRVLLAYDDDVVAGIMAERDASDGLLCCATHARDAVTEVLFHTVSARLVRRSTVPLVLVGPRVTGKRPRRFSDLVVCVDGSLPLAETLAATATWTRLLAAEVHVVEVIEHGAARTYSTAELAAAHLAQKGIEPTWTVLPERHAPHRIVEYADRLADPLLVVGTHGRASHGSSALGPVASAVVRHASCPVLVVPPISGPQRRNPFHEGAPDV